MASLVAAGYGSSTDDELDSESEGRQETTKTKSDSSDSSTSSNSDSDDVDENEQSEYRPPDLNKAPLPSASSLLATSSLGLVFNNPYKVAENAKIASLEKHVKMVESEGKTKVKNGKKICWNFRKGRCRFGSNCTYAHDSDLHRPEDALVGSTAATPSQQTKPAATLHRPANGSQLSDRKTGKKRPGLSQTLTPSKKVMNHYHQTKSSE